MASDGINGKRDTAVAALRELVASLEAREHELTAELATVTSQRKDAAKLLAGLDPNAVTPRRRGRPKKAATPEVAAV